MRETESEREIRYKQTISKIFFLLGIIVLATVSRFDVELKFVAFVSCLSLQVLQLGQVQCHI